jgi:hypothetical protein
MVPLLIVAASISQIGTFAVAEKNDPITDKPLAVAALVDGPNRLTIGCAETRGKRVEIYFETSARLNPSDIITGSSVLQRFDDEKPEHVSWNTTDHLAFIRQHKTVVAFVHRVIAARHFALRFDGTDLTDVDATFVVDEARVALKKVAASCDDPDFAREVAGQ